MQSVLKVLSVCTVLLTPSVAHSGDQYWVTSETLNRRTCPASSCGIVGKYFFREAASVEEIKDGWARVTKYYDASCVSGRSEYVDSGNAQCTESNGISGGQFAEWVSLQYLSKTRPADPAAGATGIAALVGGSDDFGRYKNEFVKATQSLLADGRCSEADFKEMGGWVKSSNHGSKPVYFTYCGGMTKANRLYLDASSDRIFR